MVMTIEDYISINKNKIDREWDQLSIQLNELADRANQQMARKEISFHSDVKLLGYLSEMLSSSEGDILEIGVWKGKSLFFMERFSEFGSIIGIDPCEFQNQITEINFFKDSLKSKICIIQNYSELALPELLKMSTQLKLLHIDGGHLEKNVIWDFQLYSPLLKTGGFLVFDDYSDSKFSPQVGPTVDLLKKHGYFKDFQIIGIIRDFPNSYVLQKN
jgi:predicted O-methyltransferase YrrM